MPEVIFAAGKTEAQVATIFARMAKAGGNVLATRAYARNVSRGPRKWSRARSSMRRPAPLRSRRRRAVPGKGTIAVVCAGTSDLPVAEEAVVTARLMGNTVELIADVGVAGIHRLLAQKEACNRRGC